MLAKWLREAMHDDIQSMKNMTVYIGSKWEGS